MGVLENIKKTAKKYDLPQGDENAQKLIKILNNIFLLPKKPDAEALFIKHVATRGLETQERTGLHASNLIVGEEKFCLRAQILSIFYPQDSGKELPVQLLRIFEEGNAVHEKWQRLFLRAGFSKVCQLDKTCYNKDYDLYFSPDIICRIPEFDETEPLVGEIKSMNSYSYDTAGRHPSAHLQLQLYMFLTGLKHGFVLCENKNTQDFKIEYYKFDIAIIEPIIQRLEKVRYYRQVFETKKRMVCRPKDATDPKCKKCENCFMRSACWQVSARRRIKK